MSSIETRQKKFSFNTDNKVTKQSSDANADATAPKIDEKKELNKLLNIVINHWKSYDENYSAALSLVRNSRKRRMAGKSLREADQIMKLFVPMLRTSRKIPNITLFHDSDVWDHIKITDLLAAGGLLWVAEFIEGWKSDLGRRSETFAIRCAEELAEVFEQRTGQPQWSRVGEIIAKNFPSALPRKSDDGRRDLRLWIKNLVNRHSEIRKKRLSKTGKREPPKSTFFPPLNEPQTFSAFWEALAHMEGRIKQREIIKKLVTNESESSRATERGYTTSVSEESEEQRK
jgi:hypothetical protein